MFKPDIRSAIGTKMKGVFIPPSGVMFNRLSSSYGTEYNRDLEGILSEEEFGSIMKRLNHEIQEFWPCLPAIGCGFVCYPCSFFDWFPTNYCINESEKHAIDFLEQVNRKPRFLERNIQFSLRKTCCSSYIVIAIPYAMWLYDQCNDHSAFGNGIYDIEEKDATELKVRNNDAKTQSTTPPQVISITQQPSSYKIFSSSAWGQQQLPSAIGIDNINNSSIYLKKGT